MDINEFGKKARTTVSQGQFRGIDSARARKMGYLGWFHEIHKESGAKVLLSQEIGLFRTRQILDPRFDRCLHASVSFVDILFDFDTADTIIEAIFLQWSILSFVYRSRSQKDLIHYKLLMQSDWTASTAVMRLQPPIIPEAWKPYVLYKAGRI